MEVEGGAWGAGEGVVEGEWHVRNSVGGSLSSGSDLCFDYVVYMSEEESRPRGSWFDLSTWPL
jgi:hypothetical protein